MKSKAIIPLAIGLTLGIFAVSRGLSYIKSVKGAVGASPTVSVVTAKSQIPHGVEITEGMVSVRRAPKDLAPSSRFSEPQEILGRVTCMMVPEGMPVLPMMLSPKGASPGLGSKIPDGMRAVAVKVDEWSGVGGWIKPGVHVDVAATFTVRSGRRTKTISKIILQNIEVAAVGAVMGQNPQDTGATISRSVTLIVKPKDVAKIHLASSKGKIRLAMRNSLDDESKELFAQDEDQLLNERRSGAGGKDWKGTLAGLFRDVLGSERPEPVQLAEAPKRCAVDLINGSRRERRVYHGKDSMEQVGFEGTPEAMLSAPARPYTQQAQARRRTSWSFRRAPTWRNDVDAGPVDSE